MRRETLCECSCLGSTARGERPEIVGVTRIGMRVTNEEEKHRAEHSRVLASALRE